MSDCNCDPLPLPSCNPIPSPSPECGRIRMFFGYEESPGAIIPGQLDKLFYTSTVDTDFIQKGFTIPQFSCSILKKSNILKNLTEFTLSEAELLSTGSFESWILFGSYYITASAGVLNQNPAPFSIECMRDAAINIDMAKFKPEAAKMWISFNKYADTQSVYSVLKTIFGGDDAEPKLENVKITDDTHCDAIKLNQRIEKLRVCYEWIKNIHDTYYGREFLVKIADPKGSDPNSTFPGICIKNEQGDNPQFNINDPKAFYIEGNGASQGFYTSDEIADGGFPKKGTSDILGLTNINWVQNNDGKIESFVKVGKISGGSDAQCPELQTHYLYKKFTTYDAGDNTQRCVDWNIDLTKLDISNYYIDNNYLYLKSNIENRFYVNSEGTWIKITLSEKVPLTSIDSNVIGGVVLFSYLLNMTNRNNHPEIDGNPKQSIVNYYNYFKNNDNIVLDGARGNSSQLNLAKTEPPCLIPQGVVIPLKSNVYRYGPYYYAGDPATEEGGGAELIIQENIAPWNFIKANDTSFPGTYPYCAMDSFGKTLAKLAPKGLQKLEKGRVTAAGLPCHKLGKSVDVGYDPTKGSGPTLLTDINVDFGSGGFTTTYNFSTYSPRLGKTEKYLLDNWQDNIKNSQYINSYLRNEQNKVQTIKKDYNKKLIEKQYYFTPLTKHKHSTPNRLIFSGYYLIPESQLTPLPSPEIYPSPETSFPPDASCDPSSVPNYGINGSVPPNFYGSENRRRYIFAESTEAYSIEYLQNTYFQLAGMSMDGFYSPVSLRGVGDNPKDNKEFNKTEINKFTSNTSWENKARLPRFAMRCNFNGKFIEWDSKTDIDDFTNYDKSGYPIASKTRDEIPPFKFKTSSSQASNCYLLPINQRYLNPYTTRAMLFAEDTSQGYEPWDTRKNNTQQGFVMSSIVFGDTYAEYQITHTNTYDAIPGSLNIYDTDEAIRQQINNFRIPALRGPLVLQGWGYDTTGKPIPNSADATINTELGQFRKDQLTDKFQTGWLSNPRSWPVGPIDLRFDRERGVWTCPSPNKIIVARLKEKLSANGKAKAELINPKADDINFYEKYYISGPNGENIKLNMDQTEILVYDFLGQTIDACAKIYVYYDDNRYIVLNVVQDNKPATNINIIRFRNINICNIVDQTEKPEDYYGIDTWGAYAGYGDKYYNHHTFGIRIDCDGNPIDSEGKSPDETFTLELIKEEPSKWLIQLLDNAGKFGPSFGRFDDEQQWKNEASTGYAVYIPPSSGNLTEIEPADVEGQANFPGITNDHIIIIPGDYTIKFNYEIISNAQNGIVDPLRFQILCNNELLADTGFIGDDQFQNIFPYNEKWGGTDTTGCSTFDVTSDCSSLQIKIIGLSKYKYSLRATSECSLGLKPQCKMNNSCSDMSKYDILFIESYARFLEGFLSEDLYLPSGSSPPSIEQYEQYKIDNPDGNAAITGIICYGDSPNGQTPIYLDSDYSRLSVRVFDPFRDTPEEQNPFIKLKSGDKVLTIFDERTKKYIIWQSLKKEDKVVKFALMQDKNITDFAVSGVLVDQWSRPLDRKGNLITEQDNFSGATIIIRDPYVSRSQAAPAPNNGSLGPNLTAFGPALGSDILDEHYNGIPLESLSGTVYVPPFVGFALQRILPNEENESVATYEMFTLEHFAQYVKGKICTKTPSFNGYYLGTKLPVKGLGYSDGIIPVARETSELPRGDLIVRYPIFFGSGLPPIGGDLVVGAADSTYGNIDGCEFTAMLDTYLSSTTNLVYKITETVKFAPEGKITFLDHGAADSLNKSNATLPMKIDIDGPPVPYMTVEWYEGFMWDTTRSLNNLQEVKIFNRDEWMEKGLFIEGSSVTVYFKNLDENGDAEYSVDNGGTVARVIQRVNEASKPGLFGYPDGVPRIDREVKIEDDFMLGLRFEDDYLNNPAIEKPIIDMTDNQQWMTYQSGIITGIWDETLDPEVKNCKYKIIYAQEAPVIITGIAASEFSPEQTSAVVSIGALYATCDGKGRDPIPTLLGIVSNPMGYGAKAGDHVTVQRVYTGTSANNANYKYIVIGTGNPPGPLKS